MRAGLNVLGVPLALVSASIGDPGTSGESSVVWHRSGWRMSCSIPDIDGDDIADLVVASGSVRSGNSVAALSGADGSTLWDQPASHWRVVDDSEATGLEVSRPVLLQSANGSPQLVVGVPRARLRGPAVGAVAILDAVRGDILEEWSPRSAETGYGASVALVYGGVNENPFVLIAQPYGDAIDAGSGCVIRRRPGTTNEVQKIWSATPQQVAAGPLVVLQRSRESAEGNSEDVVLILSRVRTAERNGELAIDAIGTNSGSALFTVRTGVDWNRGVNVSALDDWNDDGCPEWTVSVPGWDPTSNVTAVSYLQVFDGKTGRLIEQSDIGAECEFVIGRAVPFMDITGDGIAEVALGVAQNQSAKAMYKNCVVLINPKTGTIVDQVVVPPELGSVDGVECSMDLDSAGSRGIVVSLWGVDRAEFPNDVYWRYGLVVLRP